MTEPVLVTGGTGTLGRLVVARLLAAGRPVRVLSRRPGDPADGVEPAAADLSTGEGVERALAGVTTVVHCAGSAKGDGAKAATLVRAARGVRHLVNISVVGADRVPVRSRLDRAAFGYYAAQAAAERVLAESGVPWTTLRATQFHDLALTAVEQLARLPVVPVPAGMRGQPVDADEVAARLVELALDGPAGLVPDLAGPRAYGIDELVRDYLRARSRRRPLLPVRIPGAAAGELRAGANLAPDRAVGVRTWEDFLAARLAAPAR